MVRREEDDAVMTSRTPPVSDQVRAVIDEDGQMAAFLDLVSSRSDIPAWLDRLSRGALGEAKQLSADYDRLVQETADALELLGARGWAVLNMDADVVREACDLVRRGHGDQADEVLADQWDSDWRIPRIYKRANIMGSGEPDYAALFQDRTRLLHKAHLHHVNGSYEASVPIVLAQTEGLVMDVTGGKAFFSRAPGKQADVVNPRQLVSIAASLGAVRLVYTSAVNRTQRAGDLSRHGILHGRELGYDTRATSAKCWSLLDAVVEWALPLARAEVEQRRAVRQASNAGSQATDSSGRRVDDREFSETRIVLRLIANSQMGWHQQLGQFRSDLIGGVYGRADFAKRGLPDEHGIHLQVSDGGQVMWCWRRTASGWVLGIALTARSGNFEEWLHSGTSEPAVGPNDDPEFWGHEPWTTPPDWTSR